ncbi:MAG TPA: hypothetical protein VFI27_06770 [candidate division Zixibacteria bacterium]|nr:hypothetical protein [candidate division Zixibacteria bacterium]
MTRKHLFLMAIGCTVPIIALAAIFLFQVQVSKVLLLGLFLLCPALHLWMMRGHMGHLEHPPETSKLPPLPDDTGVRRTAAFRE